MSLYRISLPFPYLQKKLYCSFAVISLRISWDIELCVGRTSQGGGARNGLCATGGEIQWSDVAANGGLGLVTAPGCELGKLGFHRRDPRRERHGHGYPQALHAAVCPVLASHVGRTLPSGGAGGPGCAAGADPSFSSGGDR